MTRQLTYRRAVLFVVLLVLILVPVVYIGASLLPVDNTLSLEEISQRYAAIDSNRAAGRPMQALYQIEALAAQTGWTANLQLHAGEIWRDVGDLTRVASFWEGALAANPDDVPLIRALAETYLELQQWQEAVDILRLLVEHSPGDVWAHYQLGLILAAFNPLEARQHLQIAVGIPAYHDVSAALLQVLTANPNDPLISMQVGLVFVDVGLLPHAELAFEHASVIGKPFPEALAYIALVRDEQGKDGSQWIEQAVALDAENAQVRFLQGVHLRTIGDIDGSLAAFEAAASLSPDNPALMAELGSAYRQVDDLERAEQWLTRAVEASQGDPQFAALLALFYAEEGYRLGIAGVDNDGLELLRSTAAAQPTNAEVRAALGWALYQAGMPDEAIGHIDAALNIEPDNPRALFYKGRLLLETDNIDAAMPFFERVISQESPFFDESLRILQGFGLR
ncbi:MAG: tetratricopeptide repeat protein [Chloroflexi bacterium]|nr:MAG: tetratricopeptide repeat protein [Chloroflexota bacterium]